MPSVVVALAAIRTKLNYIDPVCFFLLEEASVACPGAVRTGEERVRWQACTVAAKRARLDEASVACPGAAGVKVRIRRQACISTTRRSSFNVSRGACPGAARVRKIRLGIQRASAGATASRACQIFEEASVACPGAAGISEECIRRQARTAAARVAAGCCGVTCVARPGTAGLEN